MDYKKKVSCPICGRVILHYIDGFDSIFRLKCIRNNCNNIFYVYSAGKTINSKDKRLKELLNIT